MPVIALTGYLGAGKTTLLNHVLRTPGARIGVVINDFGELNVDASLVTGQVDEPASITGGCICCLPDDGGLDEALEKLADPRLALDAIIVEASGLADPVAIARIIRFSGVKRIRPGGVVDVVDAAAHAGTVDAGKTTGASGATGGKTAPPARYGVASLVVVNKLDRIPERDRAATLAGIEGRVRQRNPHAHVVGTVGARIDPALLYDVAAGDDATGQLSLRELWLEPAHADAADHVHAASVTATSGGHVDPGALLDLAERPPAGVYRLKGVVAVRHRDRSRSYVLNVVGDAVHVSAAPPRAVTNSLVAIGTAFDEAQVRARLAAALRPRDGPAPAAGVRRWQRYRRASG